MSEWISVKERLPEDYQTVIVFMSFDGGDGTHLTSYDMPVFIRGEWYVEDNNGLDGVTHWMPLPEPPKEEL